MLRILSRIVVGVIAIICLANDGSAKPPNVLFLLSDDQRPDTIHSLGNDKIKTPNLDRLVMTGTAFTREIAPNPICTPSRAEILTGCTGLRNGVFDFGRKIRPDVALWPETMRKAGYHTWYVGKWHNDGRPHDKGYEETRGLYRGGGGRWAVPSFDTNGKPVTGYRGWLFHTDDGKLQPQRGVGLTPNISADFADAAIDFIRRKSEKPFFLHVNFTAPHDPLLIPVGYEKRYDPANLPLPPNFLPKHPFDHGNYQGRDEKLFSWPRTRKETLAELAVYYAVITHMDFQIGRILKALKENGQFDNTIVIFSSDHGLAVGSHGLRGKQNMYEHTIGVPLILSGPGIPQRKRSKAQCYLRDLFPTVCDLAGVRIPDTVQGRSLKPVLDGTKESIYDETFAYFRDKQRMIRTDEWKLIEYPHLGRRQLFHLKSDPNEIDDLIDDKRYDDVVTLLQKKLRKWQTQNGDPVLKK